MEINLHDGVRAVDAAVGKNKKKIASAVGKETIASAMGKRANAGAMGTGKNPKVESKKSVKATNKKKGDQNVKGKMVSMGNKGNGEKANATKASAGEIWAKMVQQARRLALPASDVGAGLGYVR